MTQLRAQAKIDLGGNVTTAARTFGQSFKGLGDNAEKHLGRAHRAAQSLGGVLDGLGNRYTALATGAAGLGTARHLIGLEDRMTRLGIAAGITRDEVDKLKRGMMEAAMADDVRIDPAQIMSAVDVIIEKTGDLKLAEMNIRNIGLAIQAAGAAGTDIGGVLTQMQMKFGVREAKDILAGFDILANQGKAGAFTLQNLASLGERVMTAYAVASGRRGLGAIREMGAMLQIGRGGGGSAEQAATGFEALMRNLTNLEKQKELKAIGIKLFEIDPDTGEKMMRDGNEILKDVVRKAKGDASLLGSIFDAEAMRIVSQYALMFNNKGNFDDVEKFKNVASDGKTIMADSARAADTMGAALTQMKSVWTSLSDKNLTGPMREFADVLNSLNADELERVMQVATYGVMAVGGLVLMAKTIRGVSNTINTFRSIMGKGPMGGPGGAGLGTAMPVMVMNWPGGAGAGSYGAGAGYGAGADGGGAGSKGKKGLGGRLRGLGRRAGGLGGGLAMGFAALDAGMVLMDDNLTTGGKIEGVASAAGTGLGGWGGAAMGAAIGTAILPGIGTAIGAGLGGIAGSQIGQWLGQTVGGWLRGGHVASTDDARELRRAAAMSPEAKMTVHFSNAPPGMTVTQTASGIDLTREISRGRMGPL